MTLGGTSFLSLVIAVAAVIVSFHAMVDSYQRGITDELRDVLRTFHTAEVREARLIVRRAVITRRLARADRAEFEDAALTVMWAVQAVQPSLRHVRKTALVVKEAAALYHHIDAAISDLSVALRRHPLRQDRGGDVHATNEALRRMPRVHNSWNLTVAKPPTIRLPERRVSAS